VRFNVYKSFYLYTLVLLSLFRHVSIRLACNNWVTLKTDVTDENGDSQDGDNQNGDSQNGDNR